VEQGLFTATLGLALDTHLAPPLHVVVVGARGDDRTRALHAAALATYRHGTVVQVYDPDEPEGTAGRLPAVVTDGASGRAAALAPDGPRAYACTATECAAPATSPDALAETISHFGLRVG
jgi:uncharacterized protein YyaL (SSP411 family)